MPKRKHKKVYYWRNAIGDASLIATCKSNIDDLINGTYTETDLEKLKNYNIYSYRLNQRDRLLFTTIQIDDEQYLLVLDVVLSHDYQKSPFLQNQGVLKNFLEKNSEELIAAVNASDFHQADNPMQLLRDDEEGEREDPEMVVVDYFNQQFIQLSDEQQHALQVPLPALISGSAGSGKTCVAMVLLADYYQKSLLEEAEGMQTPMLYVSASPNLVRAMRRMWEELHPEVSEDKVQFKTYDELLQESPELEGKTRVGKPDFEAWYERHCKADNKVKKAQSASSINLDTETAYQEFRIRSGYNEDGYILLGRRQSLLANPEKKTWLNEAYRCYQDYLTKSSLINPDFFPFQLPQKYRFVVVDESQDFAYLQLQNLFNLAENQAIACCMDSHQSLYDEQSKRPFLLDMLGAGSTKKATHVKLSTTYRCPKHIVSAANIVLRIKNTLLGGISDKDETPEIMPKLGHESGGTVQIIVDKNSLDAGLAQSTGFAIVTLPDFVLEARLLFKTELVFTPDQIKGLEYPTVALYRLLDTPLFDEASKKMKELGTQGGADRTVRYRPGPDAEKGNSKYGPYFNQLVTAITRAKENLIIYEERAYHKTELLKSLREISRQDDITPSHTLEAVKGSTAAEWEEEAKRQLDVGNEEHAYRIFINHLNGSDDKFDAFKVKCQQKMVQAEPKAEPKPELKRIASSAEAAAPTAVPVATTSKLKKKTSAVKPISSVSKPTVSSAKPAETAEAIASPLDMDTLFLESLLGDFTERKLNFVFKGTEKKGKDKKTIEKLLLGTMVNHHNLNGNLFDHIQASWEKTTLFSEYLDKDKALLSIVKKEYERSKPSFQTKIIKNPAVIKLIARCEEGELKKYSDLLKEILFDKTITPQERAARFCLLAREDKGQTLLQLWFDKEFKFLNKKSGMKDWMLIEPDHEVEGGSNYTFFHWLTSSKTGLKALSQNPALLAGLTGRNLLLARTAAAGVYANCTPLYSLTGIPEGRQILAANPRLLEGITGSNLLLALTEAAGSEANCTPLYWLTASPEGQQILAANPPLLEGLTGGDLLLARTEGAGSEANCTPLHWLTANPNGQKILAELSDSNSGLLAEIPLEAWLLQVQLNEGQTITPLSNLLASEETWSVNVLKQLDLLRPELGIKKTMLEKSSAQRGLKEEGFFAQPRASDPEVSDSSAVPAVNPEKPKEPL